MGRQRELETVQILVREIWFHNVKERPITRQRLLEYFFIDTKKKYGSPLSERSFAKAYAVISDSGILTTEYAILEFNERNIRGEKRTGLRQILFIDPIRAMMLDEKYEHEPLRKHTSHLPKDLQSLLLQRYASIYYSQIEQEANLLKELIEKYGEKSSDPRVVLNPAEEFAWNWGVNRVMDYLTNWKKERKA